MHTRRTLAMRAGMLALLASVILLVLAACGGDDPTATPTATAAPTPTATTAAAATATPTPTPSAEEIFQAEWEALIAAAQTEGMVVTNDFVRGCTGELLGAFEESFGIKGQRLVGGTRDTADRVLAEQAAGRYLIDFGSMTSSRVNAQLVPGDAIIPFEPLLIHPNVLDKSQWFRGRYYWNDLEERFAFIHAGRVKVPAFEIVYRTDKIDLGAVVTSYWDFLDPMIAQQTVASTIPELESTYADVILHPDLGEDFARQFITSRDITFVEVPRLQTDSLGQGSHNIGVFLRGSAVDDLLTLAKLGGLPVALYGQDLKERGFLSIGSPDDTLVVYKNAPHPNATQLLVNWFLTEEIQTFKHEKCLSTARPVKPSLRSGIPIGAVLPTAYRTKADDDYALDGGSPEQIIAGQEAIAVANEIWRTR